EHRPPLLALLGLVLFTLFLALVCTGVGSGNQELSQVGWSLEWLVTFPVPTRGLFLARLGEYALTNAFAWFTAFPLIATLLFSAGFGWRALPLALVAGFAFNLLVASVRLWLETFLRRSYGLHKLKNLQALFTIFGLLFLFATFFLAMGRALPGSVVRAAWETPALALANPITAALLLPLSPLALLPTLAFAGLAAYASIHLSSRLVREGLVTAGSGPYQGTRRRSNGPERPSRLTGLLGKEVRLLLRDRNFMLQTLLTPLLILGFQFIANPAMAAGGMSLQRAITTAFGVGVYVLMFGAISVLAVERQALWLLWTFPQPLHKLLRQKVALWAGVAMAYAFGVLLFTYRPTQPFTFHALATVVSVFAGIAIYSWIASALGVLGTDPFEETQQRRVRQEYIWIYMLLASIGGVAIYTDALWPKAVSGTLLALLAFALWQRVGARLPLLLDPTEEPPRRIDLAYGLFVVLFFFQVQQVAALALFATGPDAMGRKMLMPTPSPAGRSSLPRTSTCSRGSRSPIPFVPWGSGGRGGVAQAHTRGSRKVRWGKSLRARGPCAGHGRAESHHRAQGVRIERVSESRVATYIVIEEEETRTLTFTKPSVTVGRSSACDIPVKDIRVSRQHCTFQMKEQVVVLKDGGSQNGTFVNGALVEQKQLKAGDRIDVGSVRIFFERMPQEGKDGDSTWTGVDPDRLYQAPLPTESDRLERLQRIASALNSEMDLDRILNLIMDHVVEMAQAERGFLVLQKEGAASVTVARNFQKEDVMNAEVGFSRSIAEKVAKTGEPVLTVDATSDNRFAAFASIHEIAPRSVLCMPFKEKTGLTVGVVYIDNRIARGVFGKEHLKTLQSFADLAAGAIYRAQLAREREQLLSQLNAAVAELKNKYEEQGGKLQEMTRALEMRQDELETKYSYQQIIGESTSMRRVFTLLDKVVESEEPVLVEGENGTGKELIARAIHYNGPRQKGAFVAENVAAIPENLVESELFGYMRGAFTGADRDKPGLFELADGGTLFLDEVGDMPPELQKKLLRVLQEKEVRRVGGKKMTKVNVRIISATNRDLRRLVDEQEFREDLYYRLRVLSISLPPLRDRRTDIAMLATHFFKAFAPSGHKPKQITPRALAALEGYDWPGNIRELENEVKRLIAVAGEVIHEEDLSESVRRGPAGPAIGDGSPSEVRNLDQLVQRVEVEEIRKSLVVADGNKTKAAELLGISRFTLQRKMEKYHL
ncbi:MAG: sigma 54-interacting transcriptional regulator, partial [Planctomycetes bacterium]|nr:sigma 54-interacting transcriptional regulator [Planctomycetota bacterium]